MDQNAVPDPEIKRYIFEGVWGEPHNRRINIVKFHEAVKNVPQPELDDEQINISVLFQITFL